MTPQSQSSTNKKPIDLDSIFIEIGDFGLFQIFIYALICMPVVLISWFSFEFIFTAGRLDYRCKVPECDFPSIDDYLPTWTRFAIPHSHNIPSKCFRYESIPNAAGYHFKGKLNNCDEMFFNDSYSIQCNEFIYKTDEVTILKELQRLSWNSWISWFSYFHTFEMSSVFICQAMTFQIYGNKKTTKSMKIVVAATYGRRKLLIYALAFCGIFGVIMAFSTKYWIFVLLEFITGTFSSGVYNVIFVLGMEMVSPRKRVLGSSLIAFLYSTGQVLLGVIAMNTLHFRKLLLTLYLPTFVVLTYIWKIPESVRWLLSKDRRKDASEIIMKAARINKKILTDVTIECLCYDAPPPLVSHDIDEGIHEQIDLYENTFIIVVQSKPVFKRLIQCCFCWFSTALVYYGLSIQSVNLHGNKFLNFIMFSLAEYPPILITYFFLDKVGRKCLLCASLLVSGMACIIPVLFISDHTNVWRLFLLGMSKCSVTISFTILYVYTTELFPTNVRQSAMSLCSVFGCLGGMVAPQTPLLMRYMASLPFTIFSGLTIISGTLVVLLPETANKKLPDTIKEL